MTSSQYLLIVAAIYLAPHLPANAGVIFTIVLGIAAVCQMWVGK